MPIETFSFRHTLLETMENFLKAQGPGCTDYTEFFAELLLSLAGYREEGTSMYPVVFVCENLEGITKMLGGKDPIWIGQGCLDQLCIQQALKHCAPLAERRQWAIFMTLDTDPETPSENKVRYGLFRAENSPLSPTTFGSLRAMEQSGTFLVGILPIGLNAIELRAANGSGLHIYLPGARMGTKQPTQVIPAFVQAVSQDVASELYWPLKAFYYRVFTELTRDTHGSLLAVVPQGVDYQRIFSDAVILEQPICLINMIEAYTRHPGPEEISALYAQASLIRGMMNCDGITIFRSDGALLGYNAFIQPALSARPSPGGARRRAFEALASYVGRGLSMAVYRSQDGAMDYVSSLESQS